MRFVSLLMVAGVIGFSHSAEGQEQNLDGGQGVIWVEGGVDSEVPENAIRVQVGYGWPLCRGTLADDTGERAKWRDIGVVKPRDGKCHTLRAMKELRFQDDFYYLVRADTEGEVSTEGMVSEADVEARIAEATEQLSKELNEEFAAYVISLREGMVSEADVEARIAEAVEARIAEAVEGMASEGDIEARIIAEAMRVSDPELVPYVLEEASVMERGWYAGGFFFPPPQPPHHPACMYYPTSPFHPYEHPEAIPGGPAPHTVCSSGEADDPPSGPSSAEIRDRWMEYNQRRLDFKAHMETYK